MTDMQLPTPLPADLPENWTSGQIVAPAGADVGLSEQHGYNYQSRQINATQRAVNQIREVLEGAVAEEQMASAIRAHNADKTAHLGLWDRVDGLAETAADTGAALTKLSSRVTLMELMFATKVTGNPFTVTFESLEGLAVAGVWNTAQHRVEF